MMTIKRVVRELWSRRTSVGLLAALEAVGIAALFVGGMLVDAVLLRPLPFPTAKDVVQIWHQQPQRGWSSIFLNRNETEFYRERASALESLVAFTAGNVVVTDKAMSEATRAVTLVGDLCELLGVAPVVGRCLSAADAAPGAPPVVVIRAGRATDRYKELAQALGAEVRIDDRSYRIVGVVPDGLKLRHFSSHFYGPVDYMLPLTPYPEGPASTERRLMLMGRLRPGTTMSAAASELDTLSRTYAAQVPEMNDGQVAEMRTLYEETVVYARPQAVAITAGAGLLAILVVFNSLLVRAAEINRRRAVFTIKTALGASYRRLLGEELASSIAALAMTGMFAWLLATALISRLAQTEPWGLPGLRQDAAPVHFGLALLLVSGSAAIGGLLLVRRVLRSGGGAGSLPSRIVGASRTDARTRRGMVMLQCGMAAVLLGCTLLLLKTMWNLANVDLGIREEGLLTIQATLPRALDETPEQRQIVLSQLLDEGSVRADIDAVSLINDPPLARRGRFRRIEVAGWQGPTNALATVDYRVVARNYFDVAGVKLLAGRLFDGPQRPGAAEYIVNQSFVRRYLKGPNAIGTLVRIPRSGGAADDGAESSGMIVGVVADVRHWGPDRPVPPEIYLSYEIDPPTRFALMFRPRGTGTNVGAAMQERLRTIAPELAAFPVKTLATLVRESLGTHRFATALFAVFAVAAILVTALGLYGLTAGYVGTRRAEIAVRLSVGASRRDVMTLVALQALIPAIVGCVAGTIALMGAGRLLQSWLYEVRPTDPVTLALLPVAMMLVALLAVLGPLRSALKVEAIELLRSR